jgi:hypothetical protein
MHKNPNMSNIDEKKIEKEWLQIKKDGYTSGADIYIKETEYKGLGVFANREIKAGEIIEYCHAIVLDWRQKYIHDASIKKYAYWHTCSCLDCKMHGGTGLILLGCGSIYNCSDLEDLKNADFYLFPGLNLGLFKANKNIKKDQEILTWWGQGYYDFWCKKK